VPTAIPSKLLAPFTAASGEAIAALMATFCSSPHDRGMEQTIRNLLAAEAGAFPAWEVLISGDGPDLQAFLDSYAEPHVLD
jgi:hypothetical protein